MKLPQTTRRGDPCDRLQRSIKEPHPHGSDPPKVRQKQELKLNGLNPVLRRTQAVQFSFDSVAIVVTDIRNNGLFELVNGIELF